MQCIQAGYGSNTSSACQNRFDYYVKFTFKTQSHKFLPATRTKFNCVKEATAIVQTRNEYFEKRGWEFFSRFRVGMCGRHLQTAKKIPLSDPFLNQNWKKIRTISEQSTTFFKLCTFISSTWFNTTLQTANLLESDVSLKMMMLGIRNTVCCIIVFFLRNKPS